MGRVDINNPWTAWGSPLGASRIPADVRYEVTEWACSTGRAGTEVVWNNLLECAEVRLPLKDGDQRLRAYQEGKSPQNWEPVYLHRHDGKHMRPLPLEPTTVRQFLEEMDAQSGRGRYPNAIAAAFAADERNKAMQKSIRDAAEDGMRVRARSRKKQMFGEPVVTVPANIGD